MRICLAVSSLMSTPLCALPADGAPLARPTPEQFDWQDMDVTMFNTEKLSPLFIFIQAGNNHET
jgi:hypothetical protein